MNARKHLLAVLALGASGFAFAQATPPTTASPNPATAAGQQSPAGGPMGSTGTAWRKPRRRPRRLKARHLRHAGAEHGHHDDRAGATPVDEPMSPRARRPQLSCRLACLATSRAACPAFSVHRSRCLEALASLALCLALARPHGAADAPTEIAQFAQRAVATGDSAQRPFAIVDKRNARVFVFDADGRLRGDAPVLLGLARGDRSVPGIGERKMAADPAR